MSTKKTVANAIAAKITEANLSQAQRGAAWMIVYDHMQAEGEKFADKVRKWVKASSMTIFTLADAKAWAELFIQRYLKAPPETKSKLSVEERAKKAASNKLAWLRRELRMSDVKVEADKRGGANNKTGKNGAKGVGGLPKYVEAFALIVDQAHKLKMDTPEHMHWLTNMKHTLDTMHSAK